MPGFDKTRVVGVSDEDLDEFTCGICHEIFANPVVTHCCRQTYCSDCINQWLTNSNTCPNDRLQLDSNGISPAPRFATNLLMNLKIKCDFHTNGCEEVFKMSELKNHLIYCDLNPNKKCRNCQLICRPNVRHNCIEVLKSIIDERIDENNRLKIKIQGLKEDKNCIQTLIAQNDSINYENRRLNTEILSLREENLELKNSNEKLEDSVKQLKKSLEKMIESSYPVIDCQSLVECIGNASETNRILIIDIRSAEEFNESYIYCLSTCAHISTVNIPANWLTSDVMVSKITEYLPSGNRKEAFNSRGLMNKVVFVDNDSKYMSLNSSVHHLAELLWNFDSTSFRIRSKPCLLSGGFVEWAAKYPSLTTTLKYNIYHQYSNSSPRGRSGSFWPFFK